MAPRRRQRQSSLEALVAVFDFQEGFLVFRFNLKRLFCDDVFFTIRRPLEPLPLPHRPVAHFPRTPTGFMMGLVAVGDGAIMATTDESRAIIYDTAASQSQPQPGPRLCAPKDRPVMVAVDVGAGRREVLVCSQSPYLFLKEPLFEALRHDGGGGGWQLALPVPPPPFPPGDCGPTWRDEHDVRAYIAVGSRVWFTLGESGTYSLDMASHEWRREGNWPLPVRGGAVYVADMGLVFGFSKEDSMSLCACDMRTSPPEIRQRWEMKDVFPTTDDLHYCFPTSLYRQLCCPRLAYLGAGRFCLSCSSIPSYKEPPPPGLLSLTAFEVTAAAKGTTPAGDGERRPQQLSLRKRRSRYYLLGRDQVTGFILQDKLP